MREDYEDADQDDEVAAYERYEAEQRKAAAPDDDLDDDADTVDGAALPNLGEPKLPPARPRFELLTGTAGTGKTFTARAIAESEYGAEMCATTGIAAINLGAGVTTINSKLGFFDTASLRDSWTQGFLAMRLAKLYRNGVSRLVVDEISMMDGEQLEIICFAQDELREQLGYDMGLTLVGDFCQLPPVKAKFAFEVEAFERFRGAITKLTEIRRQTDLDFIRALQAVRRGDRTNAIAYFESRLERTTNPDFQGPTIFAKNLEVDRFNLLRHAKVKGEKHWWEATRWGKARGEWKLIPNKLDLKEGALVMILANERERDEDTGRPLPSFRYVNGDLADVLGPRLAGEKTCDVKLKRNGQVVTVGPVTRENLIPLDKERRKALRAEEALGTGGPSVIRGDRGEFEAVGGVTYLPLRLAYATTVHKSQGLTLDNVQVSIQDHFWEQPGMVYVALSRARTSGGMRVVGSKELFMKRINVDPKVKEWM